MPVSDVHWVVFLFQCAYQFTALLSAGHGMTPREGFMHLVTQTCLQHGTVGDCMLSSPFTCGESHNQVR